MRVVIAGGHGRIARIVEQRLAARGDAVVGLIRNPDHADDLRAAGAEPIVADLEALDADQLAEHLRGADAVVFAAGAGPGSGMARKETVDRDGAILLADAAEAAGVERYLLVSSMGADDGATDGLSDAEFQTYLREQDPTSSHGGHDPVFAAYLRAKAQADHAVGRRSQLNTTIVRPGRLTDDPRTGRVLLADATGPGSIPREDVADLLVALLDAPGTGGQLFEAITGDVPIVDAVAGRVQL